MENIDMFTVTKCLGNFGFDFVHSDSVDNSGGILCVWDVNSFRISSHTVSDSFVLTRRMWLKTGKELLIVLVYAPHDLKEKLLLWEYLLHVIHQWKGEVIIMGDFNEVIFKSDRIGSAFHANGANKFNSFIFNAGLKEVHLGGFDKFVVTTWNEIPGGSSNVMRSLMLKLKYFKLKIRDWIKGNSNDMKSGKVKLKENLYDLDMDIDNGASS
nr:RNA-directed DNA polymerase, eukaryota [Tanacetum cinerariifolium]